MCLIKVDIEIEEKGIGIMGKEYLLYIGFGFILYVVGSVGWAFMSLVYTWINCKMSEWNL